MGLSLAIAVIAGAGKAEAQSTATAPLPDVHVSVAPEAAGPDVDSQSATAFLTGIVAETVRFSNAKTSPKAMTMSAQRMHA